MATPVQQTPTATETFFLNISYFDGNKPAYTSIPVTLQDLKSYSHLYYPGGDIAWMITASVLVWLMVPGLSLFYGGVSDSRVSLSLSWLPLVTASVVGVQWFFYGYSITFSNWPSWSVGSNYLGSTDGMVLHDSLLRPVPATASGERDGPYIPEILYVLFEGMFAQFTAALVAGAAAWKDTPLTFLLFILFWTTLVYDPIARSTWNPQGFSNVNGNLDFAGGSAVHICAGATVLAHCLYHKYLLTSYEEFLRTLCGIKKKGMIDEFCTDRTALKKGKAKVTSNIYILVGTVFLWLGWFGFNGGSALGANVRAASACVSTHLAACTGAVFHCFLDALLEYHWENLAQTWDRLAGIFKRKKPQRHGDAVAESEENPDAISMGPMGPGDHVLPIGGHDGRAAAAPQPHGAAHALGANGHWDSPYPQGREQVGLAAEVQSNAEDGSSDEAPDSAAAANSQDGDRESAADATRRFRFSLLEFCNGAIIGLVAVTPAAGYIPHSWAPLFGIIPSIICSLCQPLSRIIQDNCYIVVIHGIGGFVGMVLTGIFASGHVSALDGLTPATQNRGAIDGNPGQIGIQLVDAILVTIYAFGASLLILLFLELPIFLLSTRRLPNYTRKIERRNPERVTDSDVLMEGHKQSKEDKITELLFRPPLGESQSN